MHERTKLVGAKFSLGSKLDSGTEAELSIRRPNHNISARMRAFQLNMNKAATAPIWNRTMKKVVVRLIGCLNVRSPVKMLIFAVAFWTAPLC